MMTNVDSMITLKQELARFAAAYSIPYRFSDRKKNTFREFFDLSIKHARQTRFTLLQFPEAYSKYFQAKAHSCKNCGVC